MTFGFVLKDNVNWISFIKESGVMDPYPTLFCSSLKSKTEAQSQTAATQAR